MKIVSILEDQNIEKRIAVTPETAKNIVKKGFSLINYRQLQSLFSENPLISKK